MSTLGTAPFVTHAVDRRPLLWAGRTVFDLIIGGEHSGGAVSLLDQRGRRGDVTPLHIHNSEAEIFYVLEGGITAWAGSDVHQIEAGGAVYLPAGQAHAFGIRTDEARLITVTAPGGFADFVRIAGIPVEGDARATWEFDLGRIMAAAGQHDIQIVGPPPDMPE
jgi:quercetin dioxygenase-like cupin family protein